jgi:hypothetical protein
MASWLIGARQLIKDAWMPQVCQHIPLWVHGEWRHENHMMIGSEELSNMETCTLSSQDISQVNEETVMIEPAEDSHKMFQDVVRFDDDTSSTSKASREEA